jgi:hypothetical protein
MPDAPRKYPRVPHLTGRVGPGADDVELSPRETDALLSRPVIVEEKLDGANVMLWVDAGVPRVATRGGAGAADRAGLLGPVRAWVMERADALRDALGEHHAVYAEWLLRRHAVPYTRLPAPLVGFDVLDRRTAEFEPVADRDRILEIAGLPVVPCLFSGRLGSVADLDSLHGRSRFGNEPAEGLVVRADGPPRAIAKQIDPRWAGAGAAPWSPDPRSNIVKPEAAAATGRAPDLIPADRAVDLRGTVTFLVDDDELMLPLDIEWEAERE